MTFVRTVDKTLGLVLSVSLYLSILLSLSLVRPLQNYYSINPNPGYSSRFQTGIYLPRIQVPVEVQQHSFRVSVNPDILQFHDILVHLDLSIVSIKYFLCAIITINDLIIKYYFCMLYTCPQFQMFIQ